MASKNPQIRAIELEALRRSKLDGKTSHRERFEIRNQLRAEQGFGKEQKKRGGIAGVYDRNKNYINPASQVLAGMFLGPAAGAVLGAATGFDRPGKGGIGFDAKKGAIGAVSGYGLGKVGQYGGSKLSGMFQPKPAPFTPAGVPTGDEVVASAAAPKKSFVDRAVGGVKKAGGFLKDNPEVAGQALTSYATLSEGAANRRFDGERLAFDQRAYDDERRDKERRARIAQDLYDQIMGQMSWNKGGGGGN